MGFLELQAAVFPLCLLAQLSIQPKVKLCQLNAVLADPTLILKNKSRIHFSGLLHHRHRTAIRGA